MTSFKIDALSTLIQTMTSFKSDTRTLSTLIKSCELICKHYFNLSNNHKDSITITKYEWNTFYTDALNYISYIMNYYIGQFNIVLSNFTNPSEEDLRTKGNMFTLFIQFIKIVEQSKIEYNYYIKGKIADSTKGHILEMSVLLSEMEPNSNVSCLSIMSIRKLYTLFKQQNKNIEDPSNAITKCSEDYKKLSGHIKSFKSIIKGSKYFSDTGFSDNGDIRYYFRKALNIDEKIITLESLIDESTGFYVYRNIFLEISKSEKPRKKNNVDKETKESSNKKRRLGVDEKYNLSMDSEDSDEEIGSDWISDDDDDDDDANGRLDKLLNREDLKKYILPTLDFGVTKCLCCYYDYELF